MEMEKCRWNWVIFEDEPTGLADDLYLRGRYEGVKRASMENA